MSENLSQDSEVAAGLIVPSHGFGKIKPWEKGKSPNPGGWNQSAYFEARKVCAEYTPEAIKRQIELTRSDDERVAFMACEAIINRGIGKPRDHSAEESVKSQVDLSALTDDQRATLAMLISKVFGFK